MWVFPEAKHYDAVVDQGERDYILYMVETWFDDEQNERLEKQLCNRAINSVLRVSGALEDLCFLMNLGFNIW